jgi:hypothetical protein
MIGCIGESKPMPRPFGSGPMLPEGIKDSHGRRSHPQVFTLRSWQNALARKPYKTSATNNAIKVKGIINGEF